MTQTEIAMRPLDADIEDADAFMRYAQERKPVSHAQLRQDLWALWESGGRTGYFVEIGAGDGHNLSNTLLLEKLGWNGLVVEANPSYADALRSNRKCSVELGCVHSSDGESVDFLIARNRHLSRIAEIRSDDRFEAQRNHGASVISVPTVTFDAALERHREHRGRGARLLADRLEERLVGLLGAGASHEHRAVARDALEHRGQVERHLQLGGLRPIHALAHAVRARMP